MDPDSRLEKQTVAAHAWRRYRRLMWWMASIAFFSTAAALAILYWRNGMASIHLYIAAGLGIFLMVLLGAALMGLVFLSAGTGHDDAITDRLEEERNRP